MSFDALLEEYERRRERALAMGGRERLARRETAGVLDARRRLDRLLDPGSFLESGLFATSSVIPEDREQTPADGKIAGYGRIDGREVAVVSNDFTVKGASSSATNMRKIGHMRRVATERGLPLVLLGESSGARMPDTMGAWGMGTLLGNDPGQYVRGRETPWCSAVLGPCYGSSAWYACLSDFNVVRKGAVMAIASPQLTSMAVGERVDPEELGGWRLHSTVTGLADAVADTDEEALDLLRRFLGYLPAHHREPPPVAPVPAGSDEAAREVLDHLPERRTRVYDMRRILGCIVDRDSLFELKAGYGRAAVTALARLDGHTVGIVANNPMIKGGALDAAACDKITAHLVLCDSFNIPLLLFVDTPGFVIGKDGERQKAPGKVMNFMQALQMVTVPKLSVLVRKSYGQAYLNMGGGRNSDDIVAWPTAEVSFMDPHYAARVVTWGRPEADDREALARIQERMQRSAEVWDLAAVYAVQSVVRPENTRAYLKRMLAIHRQRPSGGIGAHRLRLWPTTF
jgi:methylmalonyl-CoA decarboxylase subunit alpha